MGKIALVTGANSGIGLASALALRRHGFTVLAGARRPETHEGLARHGLIPVTLDVTSEASMRAAVARAEEAGGLEVLVNSAGYGLLGPLEEVDLQSLRDEFEVNVFGLLRMCQLAAPPMRARGSGRIVQIGSMGGLFTAPGAGAYHMSKYALESLSDALRAELGLFDVQVCLIQPTGVRTPFVERQVGTSPPDGPGAPYARFKAAMAQNALALFQPPLAGLATVPPEAVAQAVLQAATARRSPARIRVGLAARVAPALRRWTPDRLWDRVVTPRTG